MLVPRAKWTCALAGIPILLNLGADEYPFPSRWILAELTTHALVLRSTSKKPNPAEGYEARLQFVKECPRR
jgi:hypothetical protein